MSKVETVRSEKRLCTCCMEEHEVKIVRVKEHANLKNMSVEYDALYFYCSFADELYMDEPMANRNDTMMKDAYRKNAGLLTSDEIRTLRGKYGISQHDLCILLGWGGKTITRYESHQIQDRAHDAILRKLENDPEWFLYMLSEAKEKLSVLAYRKYLEKATNLYEENQDRYLRKAIEAKYVKLKENQMLRGKVGSERTGNERSERN